MGIFPYYIYIAPVTTPAHILNSSSAHLPKLTSPHFPQKFLPFVPHFLLSYPYSPCCAFRTFCSPTFPQAKRHEILSDTFIPPPRVIACRNQQTDSFSSVNSFKHQKISLLCLYFHPYHITLISNNSEESSFFPLIHCL